MNNFRYTFPIIIKDHYIYVIGGRVYGDDTVSLLNKCERFSYETNKWENIANMNNNRCTSSAFIYKNGIWVIGGYSGRFQRTKAIEKYNEEKNKWEVVDFQLYFGFENGTMIPSGNPNEMIILGGKLNFGHSRNVWVYNLLDQTIINKKPMNNDNILTKFYPISKTQTLILGSTTKSSFYKSIYLETYDSDKWSSNLEKVSLGVKNLSKFKQYNFNQIQFEIQSYENEDNYKKDYSKRDFSTKNFLFGTDQEPFHLEIDSQTGEVDVFPIPTRLDLKNFQGCCRISENELMFAGGINITFKKITAKTFKYDLKTRKVTLLPEMLQIRYTFPLHRLGNFVYAIGGREYGADNIAIINLCERFNLADQVWEMMPSLNIPRCTSNSFIYQDNLFIAGGFCKNKKRTDTIEVFVQKKKQWEVLGMKLPHPIEASIFLNLKDTIFFVAGRKDISGDTNSKYKFNLDEGDLAEPEQLGDLGFSICLHKIFKVRDTFVVFGGTFKKIELLNTESFSKMKKFKDNNQVEASCDDNMSFNTFKRVFKDIIGEVSFHSENFKRNSFLLTPEYTF